MFGSFVTIQFYKVFKFEFSMVKKKSFMDTVEAEVVDAAKNYVGEKIKKKVIKIGEFSILAFLAMMLISFGLAQLIGAYFPMLSNGLNYIILGVVYFLVGLMIAC